MYRVKGQEPNTWTLALLRRIKSYHWDLLNYYIDFLKDLGRDEIEKKLTMAVEGCLHVGECNCLDIYRKVIDKIRDYVENLA